MADPTPDPARESDVPARREHGSGASVARPEPARQEEPRSGFLADLFAPVAGFGVSFKTQFRKVATEEYPEEKRPTAPRYHGRHQLNRHPDGLEKCVGCELCAWACPADAILVEGADNDDTPLAEGGRGRFSPGERYGRVYQINYLRCIFCGLCIEACPTRALTMTNEYEMADHTRADLIFEKHQLLAPLAPGMVPAPHPMVEGTDEADYYRGAVSGPTPAQEAYVRDREAAAEDAARSSGATESLLDPGDGSPRPAGHHATHRTASPATSAAAATSAATNGGDRR